MPKQQPRTLKLVLSKKQAQEAIKAIQLALHVSYSKHPDYDTQILESIYLKVQKLLHPRSTEFHSKEETKC
jgi:hypothetical protein